MIKFKYPIDYSKVEKLLANTINNLKQKNKTLDKESIDSLNEWISKAKAPEQVSAYEIIMANQDDINLYLTSDVDLIIDMSAGS